MNSKTELVDELNCLMAEEAEAFLRYFQLRYRLRGTDRLAAESFFDKAMEETLEHATEIAVKIRALGHTPKLEIKLSLAGGPCKLQEALAESLDFEQQALDAYKEFLPRVEGDTMLEDFIRKQIATETEHVQEIYRPSRMNRILIKQWVAVGGTWIFGAAALATAVSENLSDGNCPPGLKTRRPQK